MPIPRVFLLASIALVLLASAASADEPLPTQKSDIKKPEAVEAIDYSLEHPRVYHFPEELKRARRNIKNTEWGKEVRDDIVRRAEHRPRGHRQRYIQMTEAELMKLRPITSPDEVTYFAFPFHQAEALRYGNVCPIDATPLDINLDRPGKVHCQKDHVLPGTHDGVTIRDDGRGWVARDVPEDWAAAEAPTNTRFWFVATWNGWTVRRMEYSVEPLAYAWAVTRKPQYARTCAILLDIIADGFHTSSLEIPDRPGSKGKLYRPGYQTARILRKFSNAIDLIWNSGELDKPARTADGMALKQHVAENIMVDGADFVWRHMRGGIGDSDKAHYEDLFNNGTLDYLEGLLVSDSLLGLECGYARWALEGQVSLDKFLTNCVFRDGQYYEHGYDDTYLGIVDIIYHLRNSRYPEGVDYYSDPRLVNLNVTGPLRKGVAGRRPERGDTRPDTGVQTGPFYGYFDRVLEFYAHAETPKQRRRYAQRLAQIAGGNPNKHLDSKTALFNINRRIKGFDLDKIDHTPRESEMLAGKGHVMYRPEQGHARGAVMHYGPSLNHSHADTMSLQIYGGGRELSYDPGRFPKRHQMSGFLRQTVAHNTVVVNKWSSGPVVDDGGTVKFFVDRDGYTVADINSPQAYAHDNVDMYRRLTAWIDTPDASQSYMVDLFRVEGKQVQHVDYSFHGQGVNFHSSLKLSEARPGSVASPDYNWAAETARNGQIASFQNKSQRYNPKPGNGYGFLGQPRDATGDRLWQAEWRTAEAQGQPAKMRLTMLGEADRDIVVANATPTMVWELGLDGNKHTLQYLLARERGPKAQFAGVIEAVGKQYPVAEVTPVDVRNAGAGSFDPVAFKVILKNGATDYILSTLSEGSFTARDGDRRFTTDARFAMIRFDEEGIQVARMEKGTRLDLQTEARQVRVRSPQRRFVARLTKLNEADHILKVEGSLPIDAAASGQHVLVNAEQYTRNMPYRVDRIKSRSSHQRRIHLKPTDFVLSQGMVERTEGDKLLHSMADFPMTYTRSYGYHDWTTGNTYFDGRVLRETDGEAKTRVRNTHKSHRTLTVEDNASLMPRDTFEIKAIKPGDHVTVPVSAELRRQADGYTLDAPQPVSLRIQHP